MPTDTPTTSAAQAPAELCGYAVVETLNPGETYLAIGPGGRGVSLKKLDPDCLHGSLLHPDVHDRLSRIRELAHTGVANLFGVGKDGGDAWLVWEYVEGKTLADYASDPARRPRELAVIARELALAVESLHIQGIVHGALHGRNVIITPDGAVRLTHVSPLLYDDPADDAEAIEDALLPILQDRFEGAGPLARLLSDARDTKMPLPALATRLAALADPRGGDLPEVEPPAREERRVRKRAIFGALVVALLACAGAYAAWDAAGRPGAERLPAWLTRHMPG